MATQVVEMTGDEARLFRSVDRLIQKEVQHERQLGKTAAAGNKIPDSFDKAGKAGSDAADKSMKAWDRFGNSAVAQVGKIAGAYVGVSQAISAIIALNQRVIETNKGVFSSLQEAQSGDSRLLQVMRDEQDFQQLKRRSDSISTTFGIERRVAKNLVFSARSEGFEGAIDFIARNQPVIDVAAQASVAGRVPNLFSGSNITPQQAVNATLAAATESRLSFEQIAQALPSAAEGASLAGAGDTETIAALSVLAGRFKSGDTAADRIKAFLSKIGLEGGELTSGKGLIGSVQAIGALPEEERQSFLGNSQEVNAAFRILSEELGEIIRRQQIIQQAKDSTGTDSSPTAVRVRAALNDPEIAQTLQARIEKLRLEIAREDERGVPEAIRQRNLSRALRTAEESGVSSVQIAAAESVAETAAGFGISNSGSIVSELAGSSLSNLRRDLNAAGDNRVSRAALLAVDRLERRRNREGRSAIASSDTTAGFLQSIGRDIAVGEVTDEMRQSLTDAIDRQASRSAGISQSPLGRIIGNVIGSGSPLIGARLGRPRRTGQARANAIAEELGALFSGASTPGRPPFQPRDLRAEYGLPTGPAFQPRDLRAEYGLSTGPAFDPVDLRRTANAMENVASLMEENNRINRETANNTAPRQPNYSSLQRRSR